MLIFFAIYFGKRALQILQRLHQYSSGFRPIYTAPQNSTTFYKTPETAKKQTIFLQKIHNSTFLLICRKTNLFIFSALANEDTCRTCLSGIYVCYTEKIFFGYFFWRSLSGRAIQAFHPRFLPRCRFVPRLQCYRTASDSLAPLLSLTQ